MPNFSYQLYSSRNFPPLENTFKMLSDLGYVGVEGYGALFDDISDPKEFRALLDQNNLVMKSCHIGIDAIKSDVQSVIDNAKVVGIKKIYIPFLQPEDRPTTSLGWKELAQALSVLGKPIVDAGLNFGWHNHDFEFIALDDGQIPMEIMLDNCDILEVEFDVAWCLKADRNPLEFINKYGSRISAAHVKDIAATGECADEDGWADAGHGTMDWPTIYRELKSAGADLFIMEHDNPSDHQRFAKRSLASANSF